MRLDLRADRSTIVVGASLALLAACVLYLVVYFLLLRAGYAQEIDSIEPRTARLLGMLESSERMGAASGAADSALNDIAYGPDSDSAATAATLQRDVRDVMTDSGLSISASQILDPRPADGYDKLPLELTVEGNVQAFDEALSRLSEYRPVVFVESLRVKPLRTRTRRGAQQDDPAVDPRKLNVRISLFALRLQG